MSVGKDIHLNSQNQSKFDTEDKELMKEIKAEVDIMVINGI